MSKKEPDGYVCSKWKEHIKEFHRFYVHDTPENCYLPIGIYLSDTPPVSKEVLGELSRGDGIYYIAQERAMAPGIVGEWPEVIKHPTNPHGRLVKRQWNKAILPEEIKGE